MGGWIVVTEGYREIQVPEKADGMRLDRFLAAFFVDRSRTWMNRGIREGQVTDAHDRPLRASNRVRSGDALRLYLPEIAPSEPPPPFPTVLHEDDRMVAIDKPPGLLAHPAGTKFAWALISLAKQRWPDADLIHRLDRDTSGVILLSKDREANVFVKQALVRGECTKEYLALCRGCIPWDQQRIDAPIGYRGEEIRIQMAVRDDGLPAQTTVTVLGRTSTLTQVRCELHTGRTHQIRVHLDHVGFSLLGDRMYGVPPQVFLDVLDDGFTDATLLAAGAERQALHAQRVSFPHPDGGQLTVQAPWPPDMYEWWTRAGGTPG